MAQYDVHGQKKGGYYDGYGLREPSYGGATVVGYSATSESYVASTEHVVQLGGYRPPHAQVWPPTSTHIQSKNHDYAFNHDSPGKTHQPGYYSGMYGSPHDSPRKIVRGNRGNFSSSDDDSSDDEDVECRNGVCYPKPKHGREKNFGGALVQSTTDHHEPKKDPYYYNTGKLPEAKNNYGPNSYYGSVPAHTKPMTDAYYGNNGHYTTPHHDPRSDSVTLPAPIKTRPDHNSHRDAKNSPVTHRTPFSGSPDHHRDGNNSPPVSSMTHRTPFYGSSDHHRDAKNSQVTHRTPFSGSPDHQRDGKNSPVSSMTHRTPFSGSSDHHRDAKNSPVSAVTNWTPFAGSPGKDYHVNQDSTDTTGRYGHKNSPVSAAMTQWTPFGGKDHEGNQEFIDSTEAKRRYGNPPPQSSHKTDKNKATIDCETAAKMYGGVFVK